MQLTFAGEARVVMWTVPALVLVGVAFFNFGNQAGSEFYAVTAQIAPVFLLAGMVEVAASFALGARAARDSAEVHREILDLQNRSTEGPNADLIAISALMLQQTKESAARTRIRLLWKVRWLFIYFVVSELSSLYAVEQSQSCQALFLLTVIPLAMMVSTLYLLFRIRLISEPEQLRES